MFSDSVVAGLDSSSCDVYLLHDHNTVPFTAQVKLRSITIKPGPGGLAPEKCHIVSPVTCLLCQLATRQSSSHTINGTQHINSPGLDFSTYTDDLKPLETILLVNANSDTTAAARSDGIEYAVRPSKFSAVRSVQLVFPNNVSHGEEEETCRVCYVGLKGEWTEASLSVPQNRTLVHTVCF